MRYRPHVCWRVTQKSQVGQRACREVCGEDLRARVRRVRGNFCGDECRLCWGKDDERVSRVRLAGGLAGGVPKRVHPVSTNLVSGWWVTRRGRTILEHVCNGAFADERGVVEILLVGMVVVVSSLRAVVNGFFVEQSCGWRGMA